MTDTKELTDEEIKKLDAVSDEPKETDFLWSEYAEGENENKKFPGRKLKVRDQYDNKETYKACSAYGLTVIYNGLQMLEFEKQGLEFEQDDPRWKWLAFQAERGYPNSGASLQAMMSFFKKRGLIDGYLKCNTAQECKNAIKNGYGIYTGSSKCSWSKTSKAKQFVYDADGANHCFAIVDYDDNGLRAINSFGDDWGDNGWFYIPNDDYKYLFSTYAIIDHDDTGKIDEMLYNMEYQKSIELGITNGTDPDGNLTRKQGAVMCYRVYKKLKQ